MLCRQRHWLPRYLLGVFRTMRFRRTQDVIQKTFRRLVGWKRIRLWRERLGITVLPRMSVQEVKAHAGGVDSGLLSYVGV